MLNIACAIYRICDIQHLQIAYEIYRIRLTRPWDSFIQTLCARKESMMFDIVWEDCIQEEARVASREACWVEIMSL